MEITNYSIQNYKQPEMVLITSNPVFQLHTSADHDAERSTSNSSQQVSSGIEASLHTVKVVVSGSDSANASNTVAIRNTLNSVFSQHMNGENHQAFQELINSRATRLNEMGETPSSIDSVLTKGQQLDRLATAASGTIATVPVIPAWTSSNMVTEKGIEQIKNTAATVADKLTGYMRNSSTVSQPPMDIESGYYTADASFSDSEESDYTARTSSYVSDNESNHDSARSSSAGAKVDHASVENRQLSESEERPHEVRIDMSV